MTLAKIKKANKKHRHEARRRAKQLKVRADNRDMSIRYRRSRKILVQGQKEYQERRRNDRAYIDELAGEIG